MSKNEILNFQEFCELRDYYMNLITNTPDVIRSGEITLRQYLRTHSGLGWVDQCKLCIGTKEPGSPLNNCKRCMWSLSDSHTYLRCQTSTYIHENEDGLDVLEERVFEMSQLIEKYYNLEEGNE